jgi:hypothetical protein
MLKRRFLTMAAGIVSIVAVSAGQASARANPTITETCTSGTVVVADVHATHGLNTAETHYNVVNPTGAVCSLV